MIAEKSAYLLKYLLEISHDNSPFLIDIHFMLTHFIVVPTAGTCIKDANAAFAAGICIKDALLYLQQNNDFRINAACTSRFLGRKSIIITVSWCTTMQECSRMTKNR